MIRKRRVAACLTILWVVWFTFAVPVRFDVEVSPNPIKVSEFADVTIKAIDENGNVDTSYTDGDIWIEVEGFDYTDPDVVIPWGWIGFFEASDQWIKIFSKWLSIKRAWTYKLLVADVYDTSLQWEAEIEVLADSSWPEIGDLTVLSPTPGSVETEDPLNVIWETTFPNTPIVVIIDDEEVSEGLSDEMGNFTLPVTGIQPGDHVLVVNALDLEDTVVATSWNIPFKYESADTNLFLGLDIEPGRDLFVDDVATFTIRTADRVTSALLQFADGTPVPTTKEEDGIFKKEMSFDEAGTYPIHVTLWVQWSNELFENVDAMNISERLRKILTLDATPQPDVNRADLVWTYTGTIDFFKVRYGTTQTNLRLSLTTSEPRWTLILADPTQMYYAQVFPVDEDGTVNGEPSDIISIWPFRDPAPVCGNGIVENGEICDDGNLIPNDGCSATCQIEMPEPPPPTPTPQPTTPVCGNGVLEVGESCDDGNLLAGDGCSAQCIPEQEQSAPTEQTCFPLGIQLKTKQVNDRYYLYWDGFPNVKEYVVYRSNQAVTAIEQMQVIGRTTETMYEYPFDPSSDVDRRAWYAVEAICDNGDAKRVGDMTPVKVWPELNILFILLWSFFIFWMWKLVKTT